MKKLQSFEAEYTDTFGGEANFSWVKKVKFELSENASDLAIVRKAKALLGLNNVRCKRDDVSGTDDITLRPTGSCTILFIYPLY